MVLGGRRQEGDLGLHVGQPARQQGPGRVDKRFHHNSKACLESFILKLFKKGIILPHVCNAQHKGVGEICSPSQLQPNEARRGVGRRVLAILDASSFIQPSIPTPGGILFPTAEDLCAAGCYTSNRRCYLWAQARSRGDTQGTAGCCL